MPRMSPQDAQALWEREQAKEAARIQAEEAIRQMAYQRQAESSGFTGPTQAPPEGWQPPTEAIEPSWSPVEEIATLGAGGLARRGGESLLRAASKGLGRESSGAVARRQATDAVIESERRRTAALVRDMQARPPARVPQGGLETRGTRAAAVERQMGGVGRAQHKQYETIGFDDTSAVGSLRKDEFPLDMSRQYPGNMQARRTAARQNRRAMRSGEPAQLDTAGLARIGRPRTQHAGSEFAQEADRRTLEIAARRGAGESAGRVTGSGAEASLSRLTGDPMHRRLYNQEVAEILKSRGIDPAEWRGGRFDVGDVGPSPLQMRDWLKQRGQ